MKAGKYNKTPYVIPSSTGQNYYPSQPIKSGLTGMSINNGSSTNRQRFAPYNFYKRSYANINFPYQNSNYQQQQRIMTSSNSYSTTNQGLMKVSPNGSTYG